MSKMEEGANGQLSQKSLEVIKQIKEEKTGWIVVDGPFEDADLLKILDELKNSTKINGVTYRGYDGNSILSDIKVAEEFGALLCHQYINNLSFAGVDFSYNAFATFCSKAELGVNLTLLSFYEVKFASGGAELIAKILKLNQSLTSLTVSGCNLTSKDLILISAALISNTTLKDLSFAQNHKHEDCSWVYALSKVLTYDSIASNTSLTSLSLNNMGLGSEAAEKIADMIKHNHSLRELDLSGNNFFSQDVTKIFEALSVNRSLKELWLHNLRLCHSDENDIETLKSYLKANKTITKLTFNAQYAIAPILQRNQCYQAYQEKLKKYFSSKQSEPLDITLGDLLKDCIEGKCPLLAELTAYELGVIAQVITDE